MSALAIPVRPDNFRSRADMHLLESDVFDICARVKELDPNLCIYALDPPVHRFGKTYHFSVSERCSDGVERFVTYVEALDARLIEKLQYMLHVPFEHRLAEAEKQEAKAEQEYKENELDKLYDSMGAPMLRQLEHDGFITHRGKSFPKRGVKPR